MFAWTNECRPIQFILSDGVQLPITCVPSFGIDVSTTVDEPNTDARRAKKVEGESETLPAKTVWGSRLSGALYQKFQAGIFPLITGRVAC